MEKNENESDQLRAIINLSLTSSGNLVQDEEGLVRLRGLNLPTPQVSPGVFPEVSDAVLLLREY